MIDLAQEFVFVRSEAGPVGEAQMISRPTDFHLPHGQFRVAVDHQQHKHALFPVGPATTRIEETTASVSCRTRELLLDGEDLTFVDLECTDSSLELVFEHLVADVLERVEADPATPGRACLEALDDWRDLMRAPKGGLSREVALGLTGELEVLRLMGSRSPAAALDAWVGPSRSTHDFVAGGRHLEVKATASVDGQTIRVSNIDQLDPGTSPQSLHLVVVHCVSDPAAVTLDQRIREMVAAGFPRTRLIRAIADYGYVFESRQSAATFAIRSLRLWEVDEAFPGLRSSDIPEQTRPAVTRLSYELSLAAAPSPLPEDAEEVLGRWLNN